MFVQGHYGSRAVRLWFGSVFWPLTVSLQLVEQLSLVAPRRYGQDPYLGDPWARMHWNMPIGGQYNDVLASWQWCPLSLRSHGDQLYWRVLSLHLLWLGQCHSCCTKSVTGVRGLWLPWWHLPCERSMPSSDIHGSVQWYCQVEEDHKRQSSPHTVSVQMSICVCEPCWI